MTQLFYVKIISYTDIIDCAYLGKRKKIRIPYKNSRKKVSVKNFPSSIKYCFTCRKVD